MSEKKTKTVGLDLDVWRELKRISMDREATLSETVDYLLKRLKKEGNEGDRESTDSEDPRATK